MFFGLCNSPATFQTMMNKIFADMEDIVVIYIDDMMIFTKGSLAKHQAKVKEVLQRLRDNDLFTCPEKCSFDKTEVEYLGMFINRDSICMDDSKVKAITDWPAPTVMVEDPPISFSPFSLTDCTMLSHFSFNDFIAIAFPDLAGDLDIQI